MYRLTSSLPYLLNRLGVRMGALFTRKIAAYGLTLPMYRVLAALWEQPRQTLGSLAQMTTTELSTMSRLISHMVGQKLVTRKRPPNNERVVEVDLTRTGRALAEKLVAEAQHYEDVAISRMPLEDVNHLRSVLASMYETLDVLEEELVAPADPG